MVKITVKNIFAEAEKGNLAVLKHPSVAEVKDEDNEGGTPLHLLAEKGKVEILSHPSVDKVTDFEGATPLHWLAWMGKVEVLNHPSVDKVKDLDYDVTPLHRLAEAGKVPREWIKEKYPWFELGRRKITKKLITEILNTSNAEKFIKGIL